MHDVRRFGLTWWLDPDAREARRRLAVTACAALNLALVAAVSLSLLVDDRRVLVVGWRPPAAVLLLMFVVTEAVVIHVQIRRESESVSLSEIPLVLGLLYAEPTALVATRIGASLIVYVLRRQPPLKLLFNLSTQLAEAVLAVAVVQTMAGRTGDLDVRAVVATYLAMATAAVWGSWCLRAVLGVAEGALSPRGIAEDLLVYPPVVLALTTLGFVAAYALRTGPQASWALMLTLGAILAGHRVYGRLRRRHEILERMFGFTSALPSTATAGDGPRELLDAVRELLRADCAALVLDESDGTRVITCGGPDGQGDPAAIDDLLTTHRRLRDEAVGGSDATDGPPGTPSGDRPGGSSGGSSTDVQASAARGLTAIAAPLRDGALVIGTMSVSHPMAEVQTFDRDDVLMLESLGAHLAATVRHARLVERLRHEATHDDLTGLPNRRAWEAATRERLSRAEWRDGAQDAVILLDLDGFKEVNDTLGHDLGDQLLVKVAERLAALVGPSGLLARFGGDEFAVLLPGLNRERALATARAITDAMTVPLHLADTELEVRASAGVALAPTHGVDASTLLRRADLALYSSKGSDDSAAEFHHGLEHDGPNPLVLMADLRQSVNDNRIAIAVQPQARLDDGAVVGVEVLARWRHPEHGWISPELFVALAERGGMIRDLTLSILRQALTTCRRWRAAGLELGVAVNLSPRSLLDPTLPTTVLNLLTESGVPARLLTLEITESSVMADPRTALQTLHHLREIGVRLSVDDFGTGYSSLSYLKRLPVHEVKIDRTFVADLVRDADDGAIVRAIIDLGHNLDLDVVAEGIEDGTTWRRLRELGCTVVQGYYLSRPMGADDLVPWLGSYRASVPEGPRSDDGPQGAGATAPSAAVPVPRRSDAEQPTGLLVRNREAPPPGRP